MSDYKFKKLGAVGHIAMMRAVGVVSRYHTLNMRQQNLAEHTFGVLTLVDWCLFGQPGQNVLRAALFHDAPELETGDVPAPAKWAHADLNAALEAVESRFIERWNLHVDLTGYEQNILKFCDLAELVLFCIEGANQGTRDCLDIAVSGLTALAKNNLHNTNSRTVDLYLMMVKAVNHLEVRT